MNKIFRSSANPKNISLTIKGIGIGLIPLVIIIAGTFSISIAESELMNLIQAIGGAVSGLIIAYGIIRKIVIRIRK